MSFTKKIILSTFVVFSLLACNNNADYERSVKHQKEAFEKALAWYNTNKLTLKARKDLIDTIIGSLKNYDEKADISSDKALLKSVIAGLGKDKKNAVSKLAPFKYGDIFFTSLDKVDEGYFSDFGESFSDSLKTTSYKNNEISALIEKGGLKASDADNTYYKETDFTNFLNRTYLVVSDCVFYKKPQLFENNTFNSGEIIKLISVFNLKDSGKLADHFFLHTISSQKVDERIYSKNAKPNGTSLTIDLSRKYNDIFYNSLFLVPVPIK